MGVRAHLTEIAPYLFEQVVAGGEPHLPDAPSHSIDKAWYEFHLVLRTKGLPLCLAVAGDFLHPQSPHTLDEFCKGDHEYYVGFASPKLVQEVGDALANLTVSDYKRWEAELVGPDYNCGEMFFPNLKAAYTEAAAQGHALMIVIC